MTYIKNDLVTIEENPYDNGMKFVKVNSFVSVCRQDCNNTETVYTVKIPCYGQSVHLKPDTAKRVIVALQRLLDIESQEEQRKKCRIIKVDFSRDSSITAYHKANNLLMV